MTIIEELTKDILVDEYFIKLFRKCSILSANNNLNNSSIQYTLTPKELKDILRYSDILSISNNPVARNKSYQIITFLNKNYNQDSLYKTVAKAVYSKLGNFPAIEYLSKHNSNTAELPLLRDVEMEAKKVFQKVPGSDKYYFTDAQFELFESLSNSKEYSFSGPTSMGKSFIIKAFIKKAIKNSPPENLVIIVPTRALINQFTIDLKYEIDELTDIYNYRILTNSSVSDSVGEENYNYILVLTPERLISYLNQKDNPPIGFIFVDEAHKLANEKDSRSVTSYTAIENAIKKYGNIKLYFSSPNVSNPEVFLELFNRNNKNTFKTIESPVSQNLFFINLIDKRVELIQGKNKIEVESETLFRTNKCTTDLISYLGQNKNNLIYCNSKSKTISEAVLFTESKSRDNLSPIILRAIKQVKSYIHPDYYLADLLTRRTAFHYGKLPQLIRNLVEDLYKDEEIQNVFCTSTLLEGVNMPTQNIFILNNKNGRKKLSPIDFWNLSGRAGRLSKELSGNIFCIEHESCIWRDRDVLLKNDIELAPTVLSKVDKNLKKIEKILKDQKISGSDEEKYILSYIANIISVDTMEIDSNYKSPLIDKLISKNKEKIIELAAKKVIGFQIPSSILNSNQSINLKVQNKVFKSLLKQDQKKQNIKLPPSSHIDYRTCLDVLKKMYELYEWKDAEKKLRNEKSLTYYAMIMNQWINGISLNKMLKQSIQWHESNRAKIAVDYNNYQPYIPGDKKHINIVIENVIDNIEYILRFLFEKYFNHHYQVVSHILGEENAGENWASLLEYGTQNRIVIALQNTGLSRHTASQVYNKSRSALNIKDGKLIGVDKQEILSNFKISSLEYQEIARLL